MAGSSIASRSFRLKSSTAQSRSSAALARLRGIGLFLLLLLSPLAHATQFEVSRIAAELNQVSSQLAVDLKNSRGYSSVKFSANRLSRAAGDLVNAISRNRSSSFLRSEFQDVARHYRELEQAFLRSGREHDRYVYSQVGLISNLFSGLNQEFYYTNYGQPAPQVFLYAPQLGASHRLPPRYSGRSFNPALPARDRLAGGRRGRDKVTIVVPDRSAHRSPVLDRQMQRQQNRQRIDNMGSRRSSAGGSIGIRYGARRP